jgi:valyl-tRNA synthetase
VIEKYGADSLRLLYLVGNKAGAGYPVSYEKLEGYKRFLNKIWNASKFVLNFVSDIDISVEIDPLDRTEIIKMNNLSKRIRTQIEKYRLGLAAEELYQKFWHDFCDLYLEQVKPRIYSKDRDGNPINTSMEEIKSMKSAKWTVVYVLKTYLKMLHPFIPFITEKIWQEVPKIKGEGKTIMYESWP